MPTLDQRNDRALGGNSNYPAGVSDKDFNGHSDEPCEKCAGEGCDTHGEDCESCGGSGIEHKPTAEEIAEDKADMARDERDEL